MREAAIEAKDLETWAGYLLEHSLGGITPQDRVMIKGERVCWPLMAVLERRVIEAGAVPDVYLIPPINDRGRVWSAGMGIQRIEHVDPCIKDAREEAVDVAVAMHVNRGVMGMRQVAQRFMPGEKQPIVKMRIEKQPLL